MVETGLNYKRLPGSCIQYVNQITKWRNISIFLCSSTFSFQLFGFDRQNNNNTPYDLWDISNPNLLLLSRSAWSFLMPYFCLESHPLLRLLRMTPHGQLRDTRDYCELCHLETINTAVDMNSFAFTSPSENRWWIQQNWLHGKTQMNLLVTQVHYLTI